jgi:hypothetical protein
VTAAANNAALNTRSRRGNVLTHLFFGRVGTPEKRLLGEGRQGHGPGQTT